MSFRAPLVLKPARADLVIAKAVARAADPPEQRTLRLITWAADEKLVLAGAALLWIWARGCRRDAETIEAADRMVISVIAAGAIPHLVKHIVRRRRPDRTISTRVARLHQGIRFSGNAWDSFPSGHALHLGAVAGSLRRLAPAQWRPLVWPAMVGLAATRILLLAHYATDVAAGLLMGAAIDKFVATALKALRGTAAPRDANRLKPQDR
ncbi:MAG TPA: phosphatase PAP2 family protein [Xanthobacteraceae bacterium]|jgi:undecaprenyl-diphosphatase|nr:phosphatase PAP2 family protein [Xanthobacteraceae bacterium]